MDRVGERKRDARRLENSSGPEERGVQRDQCILQVLTILEAKSFPSKDLVFCCTPQRFSDRPSALFRVSRQ